jgi:hypothetical protein|tara:strand:+ start:923 stop:1507 length:585 start_codon:yes stop_codon:yes gene_type:complete
MASKLSLLEGPIPGESLTAEPGNAPWENPPMYADPMDALDFYLERLGDPEAQEELLDMLDVGIPIDVVGGSLLSKGVMQGIHSVDVKLLLTPIISKNLKAIADVTGIKYKNTMEDYEDKDAAQKMKRMRKMAAKLATRADAGDQADVGVQMQQDTVDHLEEGTTEVAQEDVMEAEPMEAADVTVAPKGLMAKAV